MTEEISDNRTAVYAFDSYVYVDGQEMIFKLAPEFAKGKLQEFLYNVYEDTEIYNFNIANKKITFSITGHTKKKQLFEGI